MLSPFGTLLSQDLGDRGRHILDTLQGLPLEQQVDPPAVPSWPSCSRSGQTRQPPKAKRDAFKMICDGVLVADDVAPPLPGEVNGTGVFGDTPVEAKALALRYLGANDESQIRKLNKLRASPIMTADTSTRPRRDSAQASHIPAAVPARQWPCRAPEGTADTTKDSQGEPAGGRFIEAGRDQSTESRLTAKCGRCEKAF